MHFMAHPPTGKGLLEAVNDTLAPLTESSAYATFAYLLISSEMQVTYSVAAHLPIFHFQRKGGAVLLHSVDNFPVAMFPNTHYQTGTIDFLPGDILAIVTDGLTEVFDSKGHELGDAYIGTALAGLASLPLSEISEDILRFARAFGKTTDDQTLLLLRRREIELRPR
jgi:serine phosphatase RsbU (regulator of sigma subunit)